MPTCPQLHRPSLLVTFPCVPRDTQGVHSAVSHSFCPEVSFLSSSPRLRGRANSAFSSRSVLMATQVCSPCPLSTVPATLPDAHADAPSPTDYTQSGSVAFAPCLGTQALLVRHSPCRLLTGNRRRSAASPNRWDSNPSLSCPRCGRARAHSWRPEGTRAALRRGAPLCGGRPAPYVRLSPVPAQCLPHAHL